MKESGSKRKLRRSHFNGLSINLQKSQQMTSLNLRVNRVQVGGFGRRVFGHEREMKGRRKRSDELGGERRVMEWEDKVEQEREIL